MRQNSLGFRFYCKIKNSKSVLTFTDILEFWHQSNKKQQFHYLSFLGNMDTGESGGCTIFMGLPKFLSSTSPNSSKHQPGFTMNGKAPSSNTSSSDSLFSVGIWWFYLLPQKQRSHRASLTSCRGIYPMASMQPDVFIPAFPEPEGVAVDA